MTPAEHALESGDRAAFLGRLRSRLAVPVPENVAHPLPPPNDGIPFVRSTLLDPDDLVGSFLRNANDLAATVHDVDAAEVPLDLLADIVHRHHARVAVLSAEPEAAKVGEALATLEVTTTSLSIDAAAAADLGVTSCVAAIATTGSVVVSSDVAGGRGASLLPPVHLCVVPASRIVPSSAEVVRPLSTVSRLPANLVLITGPSRSGDIELIIALGVHGPVAVELVVLRQA